MTRKILNGKNRSDDINFSLCGLVFWILLNLLPFLVGLTESGHDSIYVKNGCDKKLSKIEYIIPGYQLGCYLRRPF